MTLTELLPLAVRAHGPRAVLRLTVRQHGLGIEVLALVVVTTTTGGGATEVACEIGATEATAISALAACLGATVRERGAWVDPRQTALPGVGR